MDKKKLEAFKKRLETRQQELRRTVNRTQADGRSADEDTAQDIADRAASSYTKEFLFSQSNNDRQLLQMVDTRARPHSRRQLRRMHPLRQRDQRQAPRSRALDAPLHRVPGKAGAGIAGGSSAVG